MSHYLIIDIGGTLTKLYLLEIRGDRLNVSRKVVSTGELSDQSYFVSFLRNLKEEKLSKLRAAVVGIPGEYDRERGILLTSPNIPSWKGFQLHSTLRNILCENIFVENDVNLSAMGEIEKGYGKEWSNFIYVAIGTGIGGGIVIKGEVVSGRGGGAGEIGHILIHPDGEQCGCGRRGCLEAYASGRGLLNNYRRLGGTGEIRESRELYERAQEGDETAILSFREMGKYLGWGLANLVNILEPDGIVLAGGVTASHNLFFPSMLEAFKDRAFTKTGRETPIRISNLRYPPLWGGIYKLKKEGLMPPLIEINLS